MTSYLYIAIIIVLIIILITFWLQLKRYKSERESFHNPHGGFADVRGTNDEDKLRALAFRIALIGRSGKTTMWDFDVKANKFFYLISNEKNSFDGLPWDDYLLLVHPDERKSLAQKMTQLKNGEQDFLEATFRLSMDGESYRWYDIVALVYQRDTDNKPLILSGLRWDITENVKEKEKLEESKTVLELTFTAGGIVPWSFDLNTNLMHSDNEHSVFYNQKYTIYEYIEKYVHPQHKELFLNAVKAVKEQRAHKMDIKIQTLFKGKYEWTHIIGKMLHTQEDRIPRMVGTSRFITKDVEREEELVALRVKAEESNKLKSVFLSNMSHEIRTPLNAIVGFSNLIMESEDKEDIKSYAQIISSNNDLLLRLIGDILDISKIEAGYMEFTNTDTDIPVLFGELEQTFSYKMPEGVELRTELPDEHFTINTEKNRVTQVLSNFIGNAIKYTSKGSVIIGYSHVEEGTRFFVRDTGKGISEENLPKVFERFAKFDPHVKGTGLGLSICQTIIEKLNGEIGATSELGRGSEFWFILPKSAEITL